MIFKEPLNSEIQRLMELELKKQRDDLARFNRYLPTLQLKKQQLQIEIRKVEVQQQERRDGLSAVTSGLMRWVEVFGQELGLEDLIKVDSLRWEMGNIAGIDIPLFLGLDFREQEYDVFSLPLWVDTALERLKTESAA